MATKRLAKALGLIRSRLSASGHPPSLRSKRFTPSSLSSSSSLAHHSLTQNSLSPSSSSSTLSPPAGERRTPGDLRSVIEFPAVLLNVSSGAIEAEFHSFVQPQERPTLSLFCTELTGISQDQVDSAPPLQVCLSRFSRWLQRLQDERGVAFDSSSSVSSHHPCAFVTWSDWDLGVCLLYECKRKQLRVPPALGCWIDLRATYRLFYNRKPKGLRGALLDLGIEFSGREHSGLVDARNTALLAWRMICDGCVMTLTRSMKRVLSRAPPVQISGEHRPRSAPLTEQYLPQTAGCRSLVSARSMLSCPLPTLGNLLIGGGPSLLGLTDTKYEPEADQAGGEMLEEESGGRMELDLGEEPISYDAINIWEEPSSYDDAVLGEEPQSCDEGSLGEASIRNEFSLCDELNSNGVELRKASRVEPGVCSKTTLGVELQPNTQKRVEYIKIIPTKIKPSASTDPYCPLGHFLWCAAPGFKVYQDLPPKPISHPKATPPLCGCGRRARRMSVFHRFVRVQLAAMSEPRKRNRKRYGGFCHKRAKSGNELDVGAQGVLITCNMEERKCTCEALDLLGEYADAIYGPPPEGEFEKDHPDEDDAEKALQKEVSQLKWSTKWTLQRFHAQPSGAFNVVFIRSQGVDPVELVHRIFTDLEKSKQSKARAIIRMIPVTMTCRAYPDDMDRALGVFLQRWFLAPQRATFNICFKSRNSGHMHRDDVISDVAALVAKLNPRNKVDLKNPELSIVIEVIKTVCCVSVLPDYFRFRKYNLQEVIKQPSNQSAGAKEPANRSTAAHEEGGLSKGPQETTDEILVSDEAANKSSGSEEAMGGKKEAQNTANQNIEQRESPGMEVSQEGANQKTDPQDVSDADRTEAELQ
ncbi:hypothetical protein DNTS_030209 [Danionella cerebrum]|uniref:THUMP domain-containing protein 1 n=1 Tax=Danionella cerebrum TaxID=2873325 RepID=A0A553Q896_9TELE|nr:hypothetical protein DNTS_030209 [Danionella translucida]